MLILIAHNHQQTHAKHWRAQRQGGGVVGAWILRPVSAINACTIYGSLIEKKLIVAGNRRDTT